jgi:glycosyltransferase involved in cell wall biosynthesis
VCDVTAVSGLRPTFVLPVIAVAEPVVDVILPVYNEAHVLAVSVARLCTFLEDTFPYPWRITIVDNASTDGTWVEAQAIADQRPDVHAMHLGEQGRGRALKAGWSVSPAPFLAYMDIDLSTGLDALLPLVSSVMSGHSEVAVGSRRAPGARVDRSTKREIISAGYNALLRVALGVRVRDAQCGFKAISRTMAHELLPEIEDDAWFFDTELITLAQRRGLRVLEIPVDWVEDPDSRVRLWSTAWADVCGIVRLRKPNRTHRP